MKIIFSFCINFFFCYSLYSFEILRDPIFEDYIKNFDKQSDVVNNIYLVKDNNPNAFVIDKSIYFTTGLIEKIEDEDSLKSIFYHELGHVINNHFSSKKLKIKNLKKNKIINNIFSIGVVVISGNPDLGIASNLAIDQSLLGNLSKSSVKYEIEADGYMIDMIEKKNLNTKGLINFLVSMPENKNNYFQSHPKSIDRINNLKKYSKDHNLNNSNLFEWIKSKYSQESNIKEFNSFFRNLNKGISDKKELNNLINPILIDYELYKKGLYTDLSRNFFLDLIELYDNSYIKIEFFNLIIDTNQNQYFQMIEKEKHNTNFQNEYFYYFLIGKYYNKVNNINLSNYYFCQFYQLIKIKEKYNYFCNNYDINEISEIDKSYALFK